MKHFYLRLYLVTDESCLPCGRDLLSAVEEALQAGVTLVQYREKNGLGKGMLEKSRALITICHKYNVPLLVNDRLDIALLSGADGVHLGQDDIPVAEARGVIITVLEKYGIPIYSYTPMEVKQVLTGYGRADKKDVEHMVKLLLKDCDMPKLDDTVDAIAIAICHSRNKV